MISSKTLRNFVRMHENKLNAKIDRLRAEKLDSEIEGAHWGADCLDATRSKRPNTGRPSRWTTYRKGAVPHPVTSISSLPRRISKDKVTISVQT
jgi:hypothetical protein